MAGRVAPQPTAPRRVRQLAAAHQLGDLVAHRDDAGCGYMALFVAFFPLAALTLTVSWWLFAVAVVAVVVLYHERADLYRFTNGFVYVGRLLWAGRRARVLRWEDAFVVGDHGPDDGVRLAGHDGFDLKLVPAGPLSRLGLDIAADITDAKVRRATTQLEAGEAVPFGERVAATGEGLVVDGSTVVPWNEVGQLGDHVPLDQVDDVAALRMIARARIQPEPEPEPEPDPAEFATPRVAAGVLFFDQDDRVLMVVPSYKDHLDIPGGYVEPGESPLAAAIREVEEELGITPPIGRLLAIDWAPTDGDGDKLIFLYDGGVLASADRAAIKVDGTEIVAYEFHPVVELPRLTIPVFVRRITAAVTARVTHTTRYLEHGYEAH